MWGRTICSESTFSRHAAICALAATAALATSLAVAPRELTSAQPTECPPPFPHADLPIGVVTDVIDGDTVAAEVGGEQRIRYLCVNAPERGAPYYAEAKQANADLVLRKSTLLEGDVTDRDSFGRLLRYVWLPDGTLVNAELVRLGFAVAFPYPPDVKHCECLYSKQREAQQARIGIWANRVYLPIVADAGHCIDINTADEAELQEIVHIGPALAQSVVAMRPFCSLADLIRVPGIGPHRLADIVAQGLACVHNAPERCNLDRVYLPVVTGP